MKTLVLALLLTSIATAQATDYRFVGPWFTTATINTANNQPSLVAGQNNADLGISFTCFDNKITLGLWQPSGSLRLRTARRTHVEIKIDEYDKIVLVGIATAPNLAEFDQNIGLIMREMLQGRQASVIFNNAQETYRLDNAAIAFAGIAALCPL
jgi:hypothetical protein